MMKPEGFQKNAKKQTAHRFLPDFTIDSALDLDFELLKQAGVKHILFDLDLTLRKRNADAIEAEIITYLTQKQAAGAFETLNLATNNIHDLSAFSKPLKARVFQPFYSKGRLVHKPYLRFFERIIDDLKAQPHQIAMIGDKLKYDIAPGNALGMVTILIKPIDKDNAFDKLRLLRAREARLLKRARASAGLIQRLRHTS